MLRLKTLGGLSLDGTVESRVPTLTPRRLALLAVIAAAGRSGLTRDALIAIFWPESDIARARNALNQALFVLRRELPTGALVEGPVDVRVASEVLSCDAVEFQDLLDEGHPERAVTLYHGPFLHGVHIRDASEFERWRDAKHDRLARLLSDALEGLASRAQAQDPSAALKWWERFVAADPVSSRAAIRLMEAYVAAGDPVAAIRHADVHRAFTREALGIDGDPTVLAFAEQLRTSTPESRLPVIELPPVPSALKDLRVVTRRRRVPAIILSGFVFFAVAVVGITMSRSRAHARIETIAVLPFNIIGPAASPVAGYVRDGLNEELISALARNPKFRVLARTSMASFRDSLIDVTEVAKRLHADAAIASSLRREGPTLRVTVRIVRPNGEAIWGETFQGDTSNVFQLARDFIAGVSAALSPAFPDERLLPTGAGETRNAAAYSLYLQGLHELNLRRNPSTRHSIELFTQALALDSGFALAHARIAEAYTLLFPSFRPVSEGARLASEAAHRAIAIDERVAPAHSALASAYQTTRNWTAAEREHRRAIELNPSNAGSHSGFGFLLVYTGRAEAGLREIEIARRLDPLHIGNSANLGWGYYFARQYVRAIEVFEQVLQTDSLQFPMHNGIGRASELLGRENESIAAYRRAVTIGGTEQGKATLVHGLARFGRVAEALEVAEKIRQHPDADPFNLVIVSVGLGEIDRAFAELEMAFTRGSPLLNHVAVDPLFDSLRSDPRYPAFLNRLGLGRTVAAR